MKIKRALFIGFTLAIILIFATWMIGHLWVFIILITSTLVGIAIGESKKSNND
jgi:hypothetical protein